ncbi:hypothetical protein OAD85_03345 [Actinomycetota bacterium]|nr:hypothetical protein [Actinomycetota bacterium]
MAARSNEGLDPALLDETDQVSQDLIGLKGETHMPRTGKGNRKDLGM